MNYSSGLRRLKRRRGLLRTEMVSTPGLLTLLFLYARIADVQQLARFQASLVCGQEFLLVIG